ncbi:hypothetical protein J4219_01160 [Candidatus Woesearchaeota archaeon]|nr:hypothetical protein [Candidatus Woesearchaeota archaeon]
MPKKAEAAIYIFIAFSIISLAGLVYTMLDNEPTGMAASASACARLDSLKRQPATANTASALQTLTQQCAAEQRMQQQTTASSTTAAQRKKLQSIISKIR